MSQKRPWAAYESDSSLSRAPFAVYGNPLPLDAHVRDDGSYVPIYKQEVRDEQGRRRLHGAFTGGWSAGYYNTVGSKEGWAPATFVSSRTSRGKGDSKPQQRPEDFMDAEDLADAAEGEHLRTAESFAGIGATAHDGSRGEALSGLVFPQGSTKGFDLLKKMGWREGQGIGPKIRRYARLDDDAISTRKNNGPAHLFAPDNVDTVQLHRKSDTHGLGYAEEARLKKSAVAWPARARSDGHDGRKNDYDSEVRPSGSEERLRRGNIGVGVLNDTGSDEDDGDFAIGPRISYNRTLGGGKAKRIKGSAKATPVNPSLGLKPRFLSKRPATGDLLRMCRDGLPALPGFKLSCANPWSGSSDASTVYAQPSVPQGWTSSRLQANSSTGAGLTCAKTDVAAPVIHGPTSRAAVLGEPRLPGQSVFDFMSVEAREQLVAATGKADLPLAKGQIPAGYSRSQEQKLQDTINRLPVLDKATAVAALGRGSGSGAPYADDEAKQSRYRQYLEHAATLSHNLPAKPDQMPADDFAREIEEFNGCARLFKPMTGFMATRFTSSSNSTPSSRGVGSTQPAANQASPTHSRDPSEEAAKLGMHGHITRSVLNFIPSKLLCKRFHVRPPDHVPAEPQPAAVPPLSHSGLGPAHMSQSGVETECSTTAISGSDELSRQRHESGRDILTDPVPAGNGVVGADRQRPGEEVFRAVFGDSDDEAD